MNFQRARNLTTGRLHTQMDDIYQDIEFITGVEGIFTHMIPNAYRALLPYLKDAIKDERFWDGQYDVTHSGEVELNAMSDDEKADFWKRYSALPNALDHKVAA